MDRRKTWFEGGYKKPQQLSISFMVPKNFSVSGFQNRLQTKSDLHISIRPQITFKFHYEIPCSDGNESTIDIGEYVTENSHTGDGDDTIDISEYEIYIHSDGNEGCDVFICIVAYT